MDDDHNKNAIAFWQKEVHYYQTRAGSQGDAALRLVPLAAGATALIPVVVGILDRQPTVPNQFDLRWTLLILPLAIVVILMTAVRLLHEMQVLRAYFAYCEARLVELTRSIPTLHNYQPWDGATERSARLGASYDRPLLATILWTIPVVVICLIGVVVFPTILVWNLSGVAWIGVVTLLLTAATVASILRAMVKNDRDGAAMLATLVDGIKESSRDAR